MHETLIDYDARRIESASISRRNSTQRNTFLLKRHLDYILSADCMIWPSVLDDLGHELPPKIGWVQGLWANLDHLNEHLASIGDSTTVNAWKLAVTQFYDDATLVENGMNFQPLNPAFTPES